MPETLLIVQNISHEGPGLLEDSSFSRTVPLGGSTSPEATLFRIP